MPYMLPGHNLPCPEGFAGCSSSKTYSPDLSVTLKKKAISKFLLDVFGKTVGLERGLVALQSLLKVTKGTGPFDFQSNELFSKFLRQKMAI